MYVPWHPRRIWSMTSSKDFGGDGHPSNADFVCHRLVETKSYFLKKTGFHYDDTVGQDFRGHGVASNAEFYGRGHWSKSVGVWCRCEKIIDKILWLDANIIYLMSVHVNSFWYRVGPGPGKSPDLRKSDTLFIAGLSSLWLNRTYVVLGIWETREYSILQVHVFQIVWFFLVASAMESPLLRASVAAAQAALNVMPPSTKSDPEDQSTSGAPVKKEEPGSVT